MYVPPLDALLRVIGADRSSFEQDGKVTIPASLFKFLVQAALEHSLFNEAGYLKENADIAEALRLGDITDSREHYIRFGYFEGRLGGTPAVDEAWYLTTYSDIAQAIKQGTIKSASDHFSMIGASEGRSPSPSHSDTAAKWKQALRSR